MWIIDKLIKYCTHLNWQLKDTFLQIVSNKCYQLTCQTNMDKTPYALRLRMSDLREDRWWYSSDLEYGIT